MVLFYYYKLSEGDDKSWIHDFSFSRNLINLFLSLSILFYIVIVVAILLQSPVYNEKSDKGNIDRITDLIL